MPLGDLGHDGEAEAAAAAAAAAALAVAEDAVETFEHARICLRGQDHVAASCGGKKPALIITPEELLSLREKLHLPRTVFARYLRTNERTLESWEQGRASQNAQAAILIRMVERYPDTVERLSAI